MKVILFGAMFFASIHYGWAHELSNAQLNINEVVAKAGNVQCDTCGADDGSGIYNLSSAIADIKSDTLKFIGRDYPTGSLGAGGNLSCVYENAKVYVVLEGCRPTRTGKMSAFRTQIINKDGRTLDIYLDNEQNPYPLDDPQSSRGWNINFTRNAPLPNGAGMSGIGQFILRTATIYNTPRCTYSKTFSVCKNGAEDSDGSLQSEWQTPGNKVRQINDLIMAVPR